MSALISLTASLKLDLTLLSTECREEELHWTQRDEGGVKLSKIRSPSWRHCKNVSEVTTGLCCLFPSNVWKLTIDMVLWVASGWSITSTDSFIIQYLVLLNGSAFTIFRHQHVGPSWVWALAFILWMSILCKIGIFCLKIATAFVYYANNCFPRISLKFRGKNKLH